MSSDAVRCGDLQDVVLCVKMGEGLVGEAATRGESLCTQQTTGKQIMPAFESVLGIQHARSCLIQPIRSVHHSISSHMLLKELQLCNVSSSLSGAPFSELRCQSGCH